MTKPIGSGKRVYRLYRELSLQLRNTPKRRVKAKRPSCATIERKHRQINETSAMDFFHDRAARSLCSRSGTFSRFSPAVDPRYRGEAVALTLERICIAVGYPKTIRVDQGLEFVSRDFGIWACQKGVVLDFSRPGKPTDNSFIESKRQPIGS
jgi:putative transposase